MNRLIAWSSTPGYKRRRLRLRGPVQGSALVSSSRRIEHKTSDQILGYTISRAILADAISLTRGDRFFAQDMTPFNYTSWGLADCQRDPSNPGFGSALGPLLLRTLPNHYSADSVFTWFVFLLLVFRPSYPAAGSRWSRQSA